MENLKIIQITDLHIGWQDEMPYGVNVRQNYELLLSALKNEQFDFLAISGDLCFRDADVDSYQWIKRKLDLSSYKYYLIPGNHDDPDLIARVFGCKNFLYNHELYFHKKVKNRHILFLDTSKGSLSGEQLHWIKMQLNTINQPVIVFIHHPPALANVKYMDNNWALLNREELQNVFYKFKQNMYIFCGHYHVEKTVQIKNLNIYITPSPFFNIKHDTENFEIDNYKIGYRIIEFIENTLITTVKYIS